VPGKERRQRAGSFPPLPLASLAGPFPRIFRSPRYRRCSSRAAGSRTAAVQARSLPSTTHAVVPPDPDSLPPALAEGVGRAAAPGAGRDVAALSERSFETPAPSPRLPADVETPLPHARSPAPRLRKRRGRYQAKVPHGTNGPGRHPSVSPRGASFATGTGIRSRPDGDIFPNRSRSHDPVFAFPSTARRASFSRRAILRAAEVRSSLRKSLPNALCVENPSRNGDLPDGDARFSRHTFDSTHGEYSRRWPCTSFPLFARRVAGRFAHVKLPAYVDVPMPSRRNASRPPVGSQRSVVVFVRREEKSSLSHRENALPSDVTPRTLGVRRRYG